MKKQSSQWFIPIVLAGAAALALWFYWLKISEPPPAPPAPPPVAEQPAAGPGPLHPVAEPATPDRPELVPLPPLNESDGYFELALTDLYGDAIGDILVDARLIERVVATIDNLPRSHVAERVRPVGRLDSEFLVEGQDGSGEFTISTGNYARYDALVTLVTSADLDATIDVYRRFYPLFQKAYVDLGYPDGYFNDRLVEVIDHLLETPDIRDPVELVRPHVLYEYRDPEIEALSGGQKQLIRMGGDNAARVKETLRALRARVTTM